MHVVNNLKLHRVLSNQVSTIIIWHTSIISETIYSQFLTHPHWSICVSALQLSETCVLFLHLLYRDHSHLVQDIFISKIVTLIMATHSTKHLHLHNFHLLNVRFLDWPKLGLIHSSRSTHHFKEFVFKIRLPHLITRLHMQASVSSN